MTAGPFESVPAAGPIDVAGLCHWRQGLGNDVSHVAFHFGSVCPYAAMAAVLAGEPDPRDLVAEWHIDISRALKPNGTIPLSLNEQSSNPFATRTKRDRIKAIVRQSVLDADVPPLDHVHVELHYRPKTNATRDPDNLVATLKPAIDALHTPDPSEHSPIPYVPIVADDGPQYVSWSPPMIHSKGPKGSAPELWLVLRSADVSAGIEPVGAQGALL